VNRFKLTPEACTDGPQKGYVGLERINFAARKGTDVRFTHLMHHLNEFNLRQGFRECDGAKASGTDQVTKYEYGLDLQTNLENLEDEIQGGGWRPRPSREKLIPKPTGGTRRLAIGCLEDKIVQGLCAKVLEAIYEPIFHRHSFGFRPGRSQHQAIARVYQEIRRREDSCVVVEMDIEKFFDQISHEKLMELIESRIVDSHFLRLIRRMLRNSILSEDGTISVNEMGTPQGSPISPILANIYLHHVLDKWFEKNWSGKGQMIRYADDAVFVFNHEQDATEFQGALKERLWTEGQLKLNADKSGLTRFSKRKPEGDIPFLGFIFYWGFAGIRMKRLLKVKTAPKKVANSIQRFKEWIKAERHKHRLAKLWELAAARIRGHFNYYGVATNEAKLNHYYYACVRELFKWLNRRSQKRSYTWEGFLQRLKFNPLPTPPVGRALIAITNGLGSKLKHKPKSRVREIRKHGSVRSNGRQRPLFT
jgi:group II intron reverse transcriptase/maturase